LQPLPPLRLQRCLGIPDDADSVQDAFRIAAITFDQKPGKETSYKNNLDVPQVVVAVIMDQQPFAIQIPSNFRLSLEGPPASFMARDPDHRIELVHNIDSGSVPQVRHRTASHEIEIKQPIGFKFVLCDFDISVSAGRRIPKGMEAL
jgi:hypothetical protein